MIISFHEHRYFLIIAYPGSGKLLKNTRPEKSGYVLVLECVRLDQVFWIIIIEIKIIAFQVKVFIIFTWLAADPQNKYLSVIGFH